MFTAGLAADILFYSFSEWILYATDPHIAEMGGIQQWAGVYPIFHWSLIPWGFYLMLAAAFGFMLHVRKRERQKYSEACRPILGKHTDGIAGRLIDLLAVFALLEKLLAIDAKKWWFCCVPLALGAALCVVLRDPVCVTAYSQEERQTLFEYLDCHFGM